MNRVRLLLTKTHHLSPSRYMLPSQHLAYRNTLQWCNRLTCHPSFCRSRPYCLPCHPQQGAVEFLTCPVGDRGPLPISPCSYYLDRLSKCSQVREFLFNDMLFFSPAPQHCVCKDCYCIPLISSYQHDYYNVIRRYTPDFVF